MKINTNSYTVSNGNKKLEYVYAFDDMKNRKSALERAVSISKALPFSKTQIRVEDGNNFHDGTISNVYSTIESEEGFINEYLNSSVYLVIMSGYYKETYVILQLHLDLQKIYVCCDEQKSNLLDELEAYFNLN